MTNRNSDIDAADCSAPSGALIVQRQVTSVKTIVVNGREHRFAGEQIGRTDLARLAFPAMEAASRTALTVAYDQGPLEAPSGILSADRTTSVLDGQTFSVTRTDKS